MVNQAFAAVADWPRREMLSTFTFEDAPGGKTKFTVSWAPHNATEAERKVLERAKSEREKLNSRPSITV